MTASAFGEQSAARRRLGAALRTAREQARLSGAELGRRAGLSQSKVSRAELGQQLLGPDQVQAWATQTGAAADALQALRVEAAHEAEVWRQHLRRGLPRLQADTGAIERSARTLLMYHPTLIPGLLQTEGYARAVYVAFHPQGRPDIDQAVAARMARQAVLYQPGKRVEMVIGEPALRWQLGGPEVMAGQLQRLRQAVGAGLRVGILPLDAPTPAWHSHHFTIYADRDDGPLAHIELLPGGYNLTDPADVARFVDAFGRLQALAVYDSQALALLERVAARLQTNNGGPR